VYLIHRVAAVALLGLVSCSDEPADGAIPSIPLRLGYFPNLTHAPVIVGLEKRFFAEELGPTVALEPSTFSAGPQVATALLSNALDMAFLGPNPAINAHHQSRGRGIRVVAGCTSGGAALIVKPAIRSAADLRGRRVATPQLGNTQDVALRSWLVDQGLHVTREGGDVAIVNQTNAQSLVAFRNGAIDGAWVPEPWATRLRIEGGGKVLVDESALWPEGRFVTTLLVVRTEFLRRHTDIVTRFLRGHIRAVNFAVVDPDTAQAVLNADLVRLTGRALAPDVLSVAWRNLAFTVDPLPSTLERSAENARRVGLLGAVDLSGIYALAPLNQGLASRGRPAVAP